MAYTAQPSGELNLWICAPFTYNAARMLGEAGFIQGFDSNNEGGPLIELKPPYLRDVQPGSIRGPTLFGSLIADAGDVNADGVIDLAVAAPDSLSVESVFVVSGKNGEILWSRDN